MVEGRNACDDDEAEAEGGIVEPECDAAMVVAVEWLLWLLRVEGGGTANGAGTAKGAGCVAGVPAELRPPRVLLLSVVVAAGAEGASAKQGNVQRRQWELEGGTRGRGSMRLD